MNDQRKVIYEQRREIMSAQAVAEAISDMRAETVAATVALSIPDNALPEQWNLEALHAETLRLLGLDLPVSEWAKEEGVTADEIEERIIAAADRKMAEKAANYGADVMRMAEKSLLLQLLDQTWKDHLLSLDHLRQGINLRAYAQRDPLNEYKREAFELFEGMLVHLRDQITSVLSHIELRFEPPPPIEPPSFAAMQFTGASEAREPVMAEADAAIGGFPGPAPPPRPQRRGNQNGNGAAAPRGGGIPAGPRSPWAGTPRNAPCPCGSGKKFKHCHGRV
jgi:preprotein translocase subunit SecA